jgi:hypothetical protein
MKRRYELRKVKEAHTALMRGSPCVLTTLQMQFKRESIFVEYCVYGINLYVENNFILRPFGTEAE